MSDEMLISADLAGRTLAAVVRTHWRANSWSQVRARIAARWVLLNDEVCLDDARRVQLNDRITLLDRPAKPNAATQQPVTIRYRDDHVIVVEKPPGINTVRHPAERDWTPRRKALSPTLEDLVYDTIGFRHPRLRIVHRLDKETSGLVVFARTVAAERGLGRQFHEHSVIRRYLAVVPGKVAARTIRSWLVRDRGDGRRGSGNPSPAAKEAITHVRPLEQLPGGYTLVECRLETGRTHQIRIHLAEQGCPVCGERVYDRPLNGPPHGDESGAPRLALHATELGFDHPVTGESLHWSMPLPPDLTDWLAGLRGQASE